MKEEVRLTQYSHGAGCGCKISPEILSKILHTHESTPNVAGLLVGNNNRDDAAVMDLGNGTAIISTTDFFMPIVDDAFDFGRIASANAISDVYAMGGKPILAIAILGWPLNKLPIEVASQVMEGSRKMCELAGIPLAGGHSIDAPEPIFGLAVTGIIDIVNLKANNNAQSGDILYLTKPLGVGIYTTAEKKGLLKVEHKGIATHWMTQLNKIGEKLGKVEEVHALTDITGFGLLGHLIEMCEASNVSAEIHVNKIKLLPNLEEYIQEKCVPGGTERNFNSYGNKVSPLNQVHKNILCDPQTSGGLLIAVQPEATATLEKMLFDEFQGMEFFPIGKLKAMDTEWVVEVK